MKLRLGWPGGRASWLAWWAFWCGTYYIGILTQTWVFGDKTDPRPPLFDLVWPLHFWFPSVLFFSPVWALEPLLRGLPFAISFFTMHALAVAWALAVSGLIVWIERRLLPRVSPPVSAWALAATIVVLIGLRLLALLPPRGAGESVVSLASYLFLTGIVLGTFATIALGLVAFTTRWFWRRSRA